MRFGSLCSGGGGLDLGLERAGHSVAWQVECVQFRRLVLAKNWPNVQRFDDVSQVGSHNLARVDGIAFGFPCQDLSNAHTNGERRGLSGPKSGVYWECLRVVRELTPRWVIVENIDAWRRWVPVVRRTLDASGYASVPFRVRACDVGAPHERPRTFLIASNADRDGEPLRAEYVQVAGLRALSGVVRDWGPSPSRGFRVDDGLPRGMERLALCGEAVTVDVGHVIGCMVAELDARVRAAA
jgi:DNA (cytosine-5)-methyltransferase 1